MTMIDRRLMLAGAGAAAALAMFGAGPAQAQRRRLRAIGVQLYTVRELFQRDPVRTLEQVAAIGYREVEYGGGGFDTMDHALLRRTTDRLRLRVPSIHLPYEMLSERPEAAAAMAKALGADTIVLPYLVDTQRTEAAFEPLAASLNGIATRLRAEGVGFAYHNHDFEFTQRSRGASLFDRLLAVTDPALVRIELDLFWAVHAGQDMAALIARTGPRLWAFHVKDRTADGRMVAVGEGAIDFAALFRMPGASGVRHFYVENDQAPAPYLPDITTSFRTLRALRY